MNGDLQRYNDGERMNHWALALGFILAGLSGLAFFHPAFFFLVHLFGGPVWARTLHPFLGVFAALCFLGMYLKLAKFNRMTEADKSWKPDDAGSSTANANTGRYNAGQKRVFWLLCISIAVLLVTGFMFWRPWFAPFFPVPLMRAAVLLHSVAAVVAILCVIVHVYAAIWVQGTIRAMTRGTVSRGWAKHHHGAWYREMTGGGK